jgi:hypothetical protein
LFDVGWSTPPRRGHVAAVARLVQRLERPFWTARQRADELLAHLVTGSAAIFAH